MYLYSLNCLRGLQTRDATTVELAPTQSWYHTRVRPVWNLTLKQVDITLLLRDCRVALSDDLRTFHLVLNYWLFPIVLYY